MNLFRWEMWYQIKIWGELSPNEKKSNDFFRRLTKSRSGTYGYTNRHFFRKYVDGGYYRNNLTDNMIEYFFYMRLKDDISVRQFELNLKFRIRKFSNYHIDITPIQQEQVLPLTLPKFYQSFGSYYRV